MLSTKINSYSSIFVLIICCQIGQAQLKVWNGPDLGDWNSASSWSPAGTPGIGNPVIVGVLPGTANSLIRINDAEAAQSVELVNGGDLFITSSDSYLFVSGLTSVGSQAPDAIGQIFINGDAWVHFETGQMVVQNRGRLVNYDRALLNFWDHLTNEVGGEVRGSGTFQFFGDVGRALNNNGLLKTTADGLTLQQFGNSRFDLDGSGETGLVMISLGNSGFGQDQLTVNGTELYDDFSGTLEMSTASILTMNLTHEWVADSNSMILIEGRDQNAQGNTLIEGAPFRLEGTMTLIDGFMNPGNPVEITAPFTIGDSATIELEQNHFLRVLGPTNVEGGILMTPSESSFTSRISFVGPTSWSGETHVFGFLQQGGDVIVNQPATIHAGRIDLDGFGNTHWDINHSLTINASAVDMIGNKFDGEISIESVPASLTLKLVSGETWIMAGHLVMSNTLPGPITRLKGTPIEVRGSVVSRSSGVQVDADTTWTATSTMEFDNQNSELILAADSWIDADTTLVGAGTLINGNTGNMILDNGFFQTQVPLVNRGRLQVADGPGIGVVHEFVNAASGTFQVEIGGDVAGSEFDLFIVSDEVAELDGRISAKLIDGYQPTVGDQFTVFSAPVGINGQFTNSPVSVAGGNGYFWEVLHNPFDVTLRLTDIVPNVFLGDVNQDGFVNLLDVLPFVEALNSGVYEIRADINCDGVVDLLDVAQFVDLLSN